MTFWKKNISVEWDDVIIRSRVIIDLVVSMAFLKVLILHILSISYHESIMESFLL